MLSVALPCRCSWVNLSKADYVAYHDTEWGVPVHGDAKLFEFIVLESAQAGLSWYTILRKREGYRQAFEAFDAQKIACYGDEKVAELLADPGIVRNRLKVLATISNARCFLAIQKEFGSFDAYLWGFVAVTPKINEWRTLEECPVSTAESGALSCDLQRRGFKFMGSTVCYAYMQAVGTVNDHLLDCYRREEIIRLARF